jgi:hypothetical protein
MDCKPKVRRTMMMAKDDDGRGSVAKTAATAVSACSRRGRGWISRLGAPHAAHPTTTNPVRRISTGDESTGDEPAVAIGPRTHPGGASSYDDDDDIDDDFSDLQRLIFLAGLPYCRATKTFIGGTSTTTTTTTTTAAAAATTTTTPTTPTTTKTTRTTAREAQRLLPPQLPSIGINSTTTQEKEEAAAAAPRKRPLLHSPIPLSSIHGNQLGGVVRSQRDEESFPQEMDADDGSSVIAAPVPPPAEAEVAASHPAVTPGGRSDATQPFVAPPILGSESPSYDSAERADAEPGYNALLDDSNSTDHVLADPLPAPAAPAGQRESRRWDTIDSNQRFVAANFDRTVEGEVAFRRCRVCDHLVSCSGGRAIRNSMRHALTRACLVRRVVVGRRNGRRTNDAEAALGAALYRNGTSAESQERMCDSPLVQNAVKKYWGRHFPAAPHSGESQRRRVCRHCNTEQVLGASSELFCRHLVTCVGVGPLIRDLEEILRPILFSPSFLDDESIVRQGSNLNPPLPSTDSPSRGSGEQVDSQDRLADKRVVEVRVAESCTEPMFVDHPPTDLGQVSIAEQNKTFLRSNFVPASVPEGGFACVSCGVQRHRWTYHRAPARNQPVLPVAARRVPTPPCRPTRAVDIDRPSHIW